MAQITQRCVLLCGLPRCPYNDEIHNKIWVTLQGAGFGQQVEDLEVISSASALLLLFKSEQGLQLAAKVKTISIEYQGFVYNLQFTQSSSDIIPMRWHSQVSAMLPPATSQVRPTLHHLASALSVQQAPPAPSPSSQAEDKTSKTGQLVNLPERERPFLEGVRGFDKTQLRKSGKPKTATRTKIRTSGFNEDMLDKVQQKRPGNDSQSDDISTEDINQMVQKKFHGSKSDDGFSDTDDEPSTKGSTFKVEDDYKRIAEQSEQTNLPAQQEELQTSTLPEHDFPPPPPPPAAPLPEQENTAAINQEALYPVPPISESRDERSSISSTINISFGSLPQVSDNQGGLPGFPSTVNTSFGALPPVRDNQEGLPVFPSTANSGFGSLPQIRDDQGCLPTFPSTVNTSFGSLPQVSNNQGGQPAFPSVNSGFGSPLPQASGSQMGVPVFSSVPNTSFGSLPQPIDSRGGVPAFHPALSGVSNSFLPEVGDRQGAYPESVYHKPGGASSFQNTNPSFPIASQPPFSHAAPTQTTAGPLDPITSFTLGATSLTSPKPNAAAYLGLQVANQISKHEMFQSQQQLHQLQSEMVKSSDPDAIRTVFVQGLGKDTSKAELELYFMKANMSGGGEVENIELNKEDGTALVSFANGGVAARVCQRKHTLEGHQLQVELHRPKTGEAEMMQEPEFINTVEVQGFAPETRQSDLEVYFMKKKLSGGGDIEDIELNKENGVAYITFVDDEVAARVCHRQHTLEGHQLRVQLHRPKTEAEVMQEPEVVNTVEVQGFPPETRKSDLEVYFMKKKLSGGGDIDNIDMNPENGIAYITFVDEEVAARVCHRQHTLEGHQLQLKLHRPKVEAEVMQEPEVVNTVEVQGFPPETRKSDLEVYFMKTKLSGGGDIDNIEFKPQIGMAYITFVDEEVAAQVCQREHVLEGHQLQVQRHRPKAEAEVMQEPEVIYTVEVQGFPPETRKSDLEVYFMKKKLSGGGDIDNIEIKPEIGMAYITFVDDAVAVRICEREHVLEGHQLQVQLHRPKEEAAVMQEPDVILTVEVQGFAPETRKSDLEVYFMKKKLSGGGDIDNIELNKENGIAYITFVNDEVAAHVCQREHTLEGHQLHVQLHRPKTEAEVMQEPEVIYTVAVQGFPPETRKSDLEVYFMKTKLSGGGDIDNIELNKENGMAFITFVGDEVAAQVCQREHTLEGHQLHVQLHRPKTEADVMQEPEVVNTVEVQGFPPETRKSDLEVYFMKKKLSGGGDIDSIEIKPENGIAYVTFVDDEVAARVCQREHTLEGHQLHVQLHRPKTEAEVMQEPEVVITVEVQGFPPETGISDLEVYFMKKKLSGGGEIDHIELNKENGMAYITFADDEVAARVCQREHTLEGHQLQVQLHRPKAEVEVMQEPEVIYTIEVQGFPLETRKSDLEVYFMKKKLSGGGDIDNIELDQENGIAYITFGDEEVAARVCQREHTLEGHQLQVKLHRPKAEAEVMQEPEVVNTVEVQGFPPETRKSDLEVYFMKTKLSGGGDIDNIKLNKENGIAYITFEDDEVAKNVLARKHTLNGNELTVKPHHEDVASFRTCRVEVRNIPPDTSEESLELYFMKESDNQVSEVKQNAARKCAYITFENELAADSILRKEHSIDGQMLNVVPLRHDGEESEMATDSAANKVAVHGLPATVSKEKIELYFRKTKTGRGKIDVEVNKDRKIAIITFESEDVASRVLQLQHTIAGIPVEVTPYAPAAPAQMYLDKVLVSGVGTSTTEECLSNFLMAKTGLRTKEFEPSEEEGRYLVTFEGEPDVERLQAECAKDPLEDMMLKVSKVPVSASVIVYFKSQSTTRDNMKYYFQNHLASGGGPVKDIIMKKEEGSCIVEFVDTESVKSVLETQHRIAGESVKVYMYMECLGRAYGDEQAIPKPIRIENLDKKINEFVRSSVTKQKSIEDILSDMHTTVKWEFESCSAVLECRLAPKIWGFRTLSAEWPSKSKAAFEKEIKTIHTEKVVVLEELWESVISHLKTISIIDPDNLSVIAEKNEKSIAFVGTKSDVTEVYAKVKSKVDELVAQLQITKQRVVQEFPLKDVHCRYLIASDFQSKLRQLCKSIKVTISKEKNKIIFEGLKGDITTARMEMLQITTCISSKTFRVEEEKAAFYTRDNVAAFIANTLKEKGLFDVWTISGNEIVVYDETDERINQGIRIIREAVVRSTVAVDPKSKLLLSSLTWQTRQRDLEQKYSDCLLLKVNNLEIVIISTMDIAESVERELESFRDGNKITEHHQKVIPGILKYMQKYLEKDINGIANALEKECVTIDYRSRPEEIIIRGTRKGVKVANDQLTAVAEKVKYLEQVLVNPGISSFMTSQKGFTQVALIESQTHTVIEMAKDESLKTLDLPAASKTQAQLLHSRRYKARLAPQGNTTSAQQAGAAQATQHIATTKKPNDYGPMSVLIIHGEISEKEADIMVNTTARNLDLRNGGVSASILKSGGKAIQDECNQNYPKGIGDGEIAVTGAGNLLCKKICHGSLVNWKDSNSKLVIQKLHEFMEQCLGEAEKMSFDSIAFPALGTGNLGYPRDVVAHEMYECIQQYSLKNPNTCMRDVQFVIYDKDTETIKAFATEEQNRESGITKPVVPANDNSGDEESSEEDDDLDVCTASMGDIKVSVYEGDLIQEKTDCIVNSTDESFAMSGAVGKALLKVGGSTLKTEISQKKTAMRTDKCVATNAPGLNCKHILHTAAPTDPAGWKTAIERCLAQAEALRAQSIAFPALGTNLRKSPQEMANAMFQAVKDFSSKTPTHLREVKVVIFQQDMVPVFGKTAKDFAFAKQAAKSVLGRFWTGVTDFVGMSRPTKPTRAAKPGSEVCLLIFGSDDRSINNAFDSISQLVDAEINERVFRQDAIKGLSLDEIETIKQFARRCNLKVSVKRDVGVIKIKGMTAAILEATDIIHQVIGESKDAKNMTSMVQWHYIVIDTNGRHLEEYDPKLNLQLETAFKSQAKYFNFKTTDGNTYRLDFDSMTEFPISDPTDTVEVIRRDNLEVAARKEQPLPSHWHAMADDENLRCVNLSTTDNEYTTTADIFKKSCGGNRTIVRILRIQNKLLYQQYQSKKIHMQKQSKGANEMQLWHGTSEDSVDSIQMYGFNRSYCGKNATAFGQGVYFAVDAKYSAQNTYSRPDAAGQKRMFLCNVLAGQFTKGNHEMKVPPKKKTNELELYDSVVDNESSPTMVIIFNDTQAYPEYLIVYK